MAKSVALKRVIIPYAAIAELSKADCYSLHLLGHIFNETMALTKMMYAVQTKRDDSTEAETAAAVCQATLFCRILAGKIYEAQRRLNSKEIHAFLSTYCFPHVPDRIGPALLSAFNSAASKCKWLNGARNGHAMHYPGVQHWEAGLKVLAENNAGFEFVCGELDGNMLYHSSDAMAGLAFFHEVDPGDWRTGAETMMNDLLQLGAHLGEFIQTALKSFISNAKDHDASSAKAVFEEALPSLDAPDFDQFEVPYFYSFNEA
ncbi:hypothetical protein [Paraburkholderia nodosa]|uniref:hypothetical protein n=1 Tax=Paraburkholderia nodosa TaxID=392320 RepID=UPI0008412C93|nr:hypothetical protein [Paraburkholderia nodosa]